MSTSLLCKQPYLKEKNNITSYLIVCKEVIKMRNIFQRKKKGGVVSDLVFGVGGLIIGVIVAFVIVSTLLDANLLTAGSQENATAYAMAHNLTTGVNQVASKIPTILLIGAVVLLFGVIVLLVAQSRRMGIGGGGGSL